MFMTGCVVLVMSRQVMMYWFMSRCQSMSYLHSKCHNWAKDT